MAQFDREASSMKSLGGSKLLPLRMIEATVFLGTFNASEMFWYPSPDLCLDTIPSRSSTDNSLDLMAWFLLWHALSTVGPYIDRQVCAFPNHVQPIEFTTSGLQSSCGNISRMINGNRMHLSSMSIRITKGLNTYVNKVFLFFLDWWGKKILYPF